ncbi:beta transducin [Xanthoria calcicola]
MVKSYLKYEHSKTFGLITSPSSNVLWTPGEDIQNAALRQSGAGRAIVGADEEVLCWDVKKGELLSRWRDQDCVAEVTSIARSTADPDVYAVGYADGSIRIWDASIASIVVSFNGHRSAVNIMAFDNEGSRLASGSKDTDVIVWDLVAEVGLYKLRGHENQITGLHFLQPNGAMVGNDDETGQSLTSNGVVSGNQDQPGFLLTTSKDAKIKIWDMSTQHCIETHVAQSNGECWVLGLSPDGSGCITAGNDGELRIWSIDQHGLADKASQIDQGSNRKYLKERGSLQRQGKDRTTGVKFHPGGKYIAAHGSEKAIELWRIRSETEVQKTLARKRRRRKEKALAAQSKPGHFDPVNNDDKVEGLATADLTDVIVPYVIVRTGGKVKSVDWGQGSTSKSLHLLSANTNNELELYSIPSRQPEQKTKSEEPPDYSRKFAVDMPGHRTDVRSVTLSSDDRMLASSSNGSLKIWNVRTQSCIRTIDCGYSLCSSFLPGDKIVVVGNRNGELEVFDIASSTLIETVKAHNGPIWTLHVHPDGKSMATGSADKTAKFFNFEVVEDEIPGTRRTSPRFKLVHTRTLKLSDDILSLRFSPDSRLVSLSLLDNTVKVFFVDSLKLFLNLYGHKLPVLNMDISYDSKLIVTCSADKNVRVWGLDFGDCHKAFFAHQDSVMQVAFIPHNQDGNGHHFFSASKDRMIKYWDGDKFEQIQKLDGHHGEVWAMTVSRTGEFLVTASHDKSIRIWHQTDEQIFLEEEREKELEELYESTLTTSLEQHEEPGAEKAEVTAAGKQTTETLMAGEKIVEALEIGLPDLEAMREWERAKGRQPNTGPPDRHPIFLYMNTSAEAHVLNVVQRIKAAALQDALLVLPFNQITALFTFLEIWAEKQWNIPLTCRVLFFVLKIHHKQIVASKTMRPMLDGIRQRLRRALQRQKDEMGFNLAALSFIGSRMKDKGSKDYVDEVLWEEEEEKIGKGKKKRGFVDVA